VAEADGGRPIQLDAEYCRRLLPRRDPEGHKFTFGRVTTIAGSLDFAGAAYLAALGAARGGAGLVAMAVPDSLKRVFAARLPEAVLIGLPQVDGGSIDPDEAFRAILEREPEALVVGPGLKETDDYRRLTTELLTRLTKPAVIDAGAISMFGERPDLARSLKASCVFTPHAGEFARLTGHKPGEGDDGRVSSARAAAMDLGQVVVLKGARTVIAAPDGRTAIAPFANAALATAGSGDVLAGLIGALLAQGAEPFEAACLGVYLHGRAGERLSWRFGDAGVLASDIAHELPMTRHELDAHSG
jgi:NAD(P)H-hydrate epimerase